MIFVYVEYSTVPGLKTSYLSTYVVALAISMFQKLEIDKLWITVGKGTDLR